MHDCPECYEAGDGDGEDTWFDDPEDCLHNCNEYEDFDDYDQ